MHTEWVNVWSKRHQELPRQRQAKLLKAKGEGNAGKRRLGQGIFIGQGLEKFRKRDRLFVGDRQMYPGCRSNATAAD